MLRNIVALLAAAAWSPATALAGDVGVGTTVQLAGSSFWEDYLGVLGYLEQEASFRLASLMNHPGSFTYPSLDIRVDDTVIQVHALETISALVAPEIDPLVVGANVVHMPLSAPLLGEGKLALFGGVGGSLDFVATADEALVQLGVLAPVGVRLGKKSRLAVYAMPSLQVRAGSAVGEVQFGVPSAELLASAWF